MRGRTVVRPLAAALCLLVVAACGGGGGGTEVASCDRRYGEPNAAPVTDPALREISGIVASRRNGDTYWVHNDSGDTARIFAIGGDGRTRATLTLAGATAVDWEDIAIGPGPKRWQQYLYLADIGDNLGTRPTVQVYRVPEPEIDPDAVVVDELEGAARLSLRYPDGPHDAEALLVDPRTGDLVVITKTSDGGAQPAYRARAPFAATGDTALERFATVRTGPTITGAITAADLDRAGTRMILRTYATVRVVAGTSETPLAALLERGPGTVTCRPPAPVEVQGEAIAFEPDGRGFASVSEGGAPVLRRYAPAP
ncbi:MAG: hypothetical protein ACKOZL_02085 [Actinomycetes bacterium]